MQLHKIGLKKVNMNLGWKCWRFFFFFHEYKLHNLVFKLKTTRIWPLLAEKLFFFFPHMCVGSFLHDMSNEQPSGKSKTMGLGFELLIQVLCTILLPWKKPNKHTKKLSMCFHGSRNNLTETLPQSTFWNCFSWDGEDGRKGSYRTQKRYHSCPLLIKWSF